MAIQWYHQTIVHGEKYYMLYNTCKSFHDYLHFDQTISMHAYNCILSCLFENNNYSRLWMWLSILLGLMLISVFGISVWHHIANSPWLALRHLHVTSLFPFFSRPLCSTLPYLTYDVYMHLCPMLERCIKIELFDNFLDVRLTEAIHFLLVCAYVNMVINNVYGPQYRQSSLHSFSATPTACTSPYSAHSLTCMV